MGQLYKLHVPEPVGGEAMCGAVKLETAHVAHHLLALINAKRGVRETASAIDTCHKQCSPASVHG